MHTRSWNPRIFAAPWSRYKRTWKSRGKGASVCVHMYVLFPLFCLFVHSSCDIRACMYICMVCFCRFTSPPLQRILEEQRQERIYVCRFVCSVLFSCVDEICVHVCMYVCLIFFLDSYRLDHVTNELGRAEEGACMYVFVSLSLPLFSFLCVDVILCAYMYVCMYVCFFSIQREHLTWASIVSMNVYKSWICVMNMCIMSLNHEYVSIVSMNAYKSRICLDDSIHQSRVCINQKKCV